MDIHCSHTKTVDTNTLVPNPKNPNKHTKEQIELLAKIIKHQGWRNPIVVSKRSGFITKGHARLEAAGLMGWSSVPIDEQEYPSEAMEYADMVADNKIAELAESDMSMIETDFKDFPDLDPDLLGIPGFDVSMPFTPESDEDDVPETPVDPVAKLGQVYQLGEHRLMCGDCTELDEYGFDLVVTDPPYNVDIGITDIKEAKYRKRRTDGLGVANDNMSNADFRSFLLSVFKKMAEGMNPGAAYYIFHADLEGYNFRGAVLDSGLMLKQCLIWNKSHLVMGRQDYQWKHEPILYGWKEGAAHTWETDRKQTTVIDFDRPSSSKFHPTTKPVGLIEYLIKNSSKPGAKVLDPFGGSGSTLIACEKTKRKCFMMEIEPKYIDVIIKRWEDYTGKKAELIDGPTA